MTSIGALASAIEEAGPGGSDEQTVPETEQQTHSQEVDTSKKQQESMGQESSSQVGVQFTQLGS